MGLGNPGANRESKACPLLRVGPGTIGPEETMEDAGQIIGRYADPLIGDRQARARSFCDERDLDLPVGMRVLDRILHQIQQQLSQPEFVALDDGRLHRAERDGDVAILSEQRRLPVDVFDERFQADRQRLHSHLSHVGAGKEEQLIDDARHAIDFF